MKMSDRSAFSALSFFIIVVGLTFYPGNAARAIEQDHGNPGKFIENIRKGLSGLSKYFWSPKEQLPVDSKEQRVTGDKPVAPVSKTPKADAKPVSKPVSKEALKKMDGKPAATSLAIDKQKQMVKPPQTIKPDSKAARLNAIPKTTFESKAVIDRKKQLAASKKPKTLANKTGSPSKTVLKKTKPALKVTSTQKIKPAPKAAGLSKKAHAQPASQSQAINQAQKKRAKKPAREKMSSLATARPIDKKKSQPKQAQKPVTKNSIVASGEPGKQLIKKSPVAAMAAVSPKPAQQQLVKNDKGTYIWVPHRGSQLSQRFGLTGIPAKALAANGDLNRTDGRWIFAPKKPGQLPSIYGLSGEIHAAGDAGVWVGRGRNWVYVFDKGRNYGSIVGGKKASKKAAAKPAKPVASLKPGAQKSGELNKAKKSQAQQKTQQKTKNNGATTPQKGIEVKKSAKLAAKGPQKQAAVKPANKRMAQANPGPKTARNGKWSRVNNRWVYVPQAHPGKAAPSSVKGLAEQVAKAPVTGGWVQRNNRWVYVAPRQQGPRAGASGVNGSNKNKKGGVGAAPVPKATMALGASKRAGIAPKAKAGAAKPDLDIVQKPRITKAPKMDTKTGLAEGPDNKTSKVSKNQKIWVRKNNSWAYVYATPAEAPSSTGPRGAKSKGARKAANNSAPQNAQKQGSMSQGTAKPLGEFMFFVPGRTPGTGSWFIAPLQLLEKARKVKRGANGALR